MDMFIQKTASMTMTMRTAIRTQGTLMLQAKRARIPMVIPMTMCTVIPMTMCTVIRTTMRTAWERKSRLRRMPCGISGWMVRILP